METRKEILRITGNKSTHIFRIGCRQLKLPSHITEKKDWKI